MSKTIEPGISTRRWLLAHVLVVLTLLLLAYMLLLNVQYAATQELPQPSVGARVLIALGVPSVFWLWGWMLTDFFRSKAKQHSVAWGWFLVLGNWLAAIVYFFIVWRRSHVRQS
jgi:hypothetical protein